MRTLLMVMTATWVWAGLASLAGADEPVRLKMKLAPGLQLHLRFHESYDREDTFSGRSRTTTRFRDYTQELTITYLRQRDDGGYDVRIDTLAVKADLSIPGEGKFAFDSNTSKEQDTDLVVAPYMRRVLDNPFLVAVDDRGSPLTAAGLERTIKYCNRAVKALFNHDHWQSVLRRTVILNLPEDPVAVGDSWEYEREESWISGRATRRFESVAALAGLEERDGRPLANVIVETVMSVEMNPEAAMQNISVELIDPMITYDAWLDVGAGQVTEMTSSLDYTVVIRFPRQSDEEDAEPEMQEQRVKVSVEESLELLGHKMLPASEIKELAKDRRLPKIDKKDLKDLVRERMRERGVRPEQEKEEASEEEKASTEASPEGDEPQQAEEED